ncbi:MAG TPA: TetR family transcriptional regulator [Candidatus Corynebacterium avicola]|uniref:TetR family transcriptional regulator n=1 Tax=Candidatus Corynebacterium avicola TaxID=2838527 RepID=A0A9D1RRG2_9CORY|nr:TetR family transcriptional regulator [Candidatus Corynebacterium avicola]
MTTDADPSTALPGTHRRYGCSVEEYRLVLDTAIPELVRSGLAAETRDIAVGAGVSPNHPLLRNTQVLYDEALRYAFRLIWPRPEDLEVERLVPAEAVRTLVRTAYRRHRAHPDAVRLIVTENIAGHGQIGGRLDVLESSPVVLQIDRVLMRGQDYGAFRPGISAEDVYVLITSLCCFPASQGTTFHTNYGTDLDNAQTVDGLEKLACDTVLAFLTTSMPTDQGSSYTHASPTKTTPSSVSASLYTAGDGGAVEGVVTFQAGDGHDTDELMRLARAGYDQENDEGYGQTEGYSYAGGSADEESDAPFAAEGDDEVPAEASSESPVETTGDEAVAGDEPDDRDSEAADGEFTEFEKLVEASEAAAGHSSYQGYQAYNGFPDPDKTSDPDAENTADDHIAGLYDD